MVRLWRHQSVCVRAARAEQSPHRPREQRPRRGLGVPGVKRPLRVLAVVNVQSLPRVLGPSSEQSVRRVLGAPSVQSPGREQLLAGGVCLNRVFVEKQTRFLASQSRELTISNKTQIIAQKFYICFILCGVIKLSSYVKKSIQYKSTSSSLFWDASAVAAGIPDPMSAQIFVLFVSPDIVFVYIFCIVFIRKISFYYVWRPNKPMCSAYIV